jgi:hypothetical protein
VGVSLPPNSLTSKAQIDGARCFTGCLDWTSCVVLSASSLDFLAISYPLNSELLWTKSGRLSYVCVGRIK